MADSDTVERVTRLVAPIVADLGLELYDVEFRGGTLRITIDTPAELEAGVDLEQISLVTRLVGRELDHDDPMPGHYTLEVSSPGLERSLRTPAHFRRALGGEVAVRLREVVHGERRVHGTLIAADEHTVTVRADDGGERTIEMAQIDRARTVFVWGPAPKPGKSRKPDGRPEPQAAREAPATSRTPREENAQRTTSRPSEKENA